MDAIVLSMTCFYKLSIVSFTLSEKWWEFSFTMFLSKASLASLRLTWWKMFSMWFKSGLLGGILYFLPPTQSIASVAFYRSTQRAVLQNSYSTVGILLVKLIQFFCLAGKMKYICWETVFKNFLLNGHCRREAAIVYLELWTIFENLMKLWIFVMKRT